MRPCFIAVGLLLSGCSEPEAEPTCGAAPEPVRVGAPPPELEHTVFDAERSKVAGGHVLLHFSQGDGSWAVVIDGCGRQVWSAAPELEGNRIFRAKLGRDGTSVLVAEHSFDRTSDTGWLRRLDARDGRVLSRTRLTEAHHDFEELADGSIVWLSWEFLENEWFPWLEEDLVTDALRTAPEGEERPSDKRLFRVSTDLGLEPWWVCNHMMPSHIMPGHAQWTHGNSVVWEPESETFTVLLRFWDAMVRVGRSGDVRWSLGGPLDEFTAVGDTRLPTHAHMSEVWPGGMVVFDNRNHLGPPSRVVEYALDEDARTLEEVWSLDEPEGRKVHFLGDARRLPGGHVLVAWSALGVLSEVTRSGDVLWELRGERIDRVQFLSDWPDG